MPAKNPPTIGKLTNTRGGDLMWSNTDLEYINEFVQDIMEDVPQQQSSYYRNYREKVNKENEKKKQIQTLQKMNEPIPQAQVLRNLPSRSQRIQNNLPPTGPYLAGPDTISSSSTRKRVKRKIYIDSKHRNLDLYPDASDFVVGWGRTYQNVVSISLSSLEFPNVVPTIPATANSLSWINLEDADLDFPVYTIEASVGSYTYDSLSNELSNNFRMISRRNGQIDENGNLPIKHYFIVDAVEETDYFGFTSIIASPAANNPITTIGGSSLISFTSPNHGYRDGERVHILGVMGIIGGLQAVDINGAYTITVVDPNTFQFTVTGVAQTTATGGGALVKTGRESAFQFLFGTHGNNISDLLGFPVENSSIPIPAQDAYSNGPITSKIIDITGVIPGNEYATIIAPNHGLQIQDRVYLWNFYVSPSIYEDQTHKGIFEVYTVPSPDTFQIRYYISSVSDITNAFVGTQLFTMYYPGHNFNRIVDIIQSSPNAVQITTLFDHGFDDKSYVRITGSNSIPSIDGYYKVYPVDNDRFIIQSADLTNPLALTSGGFRGILSTDYTFYLYNVIPFGGFTQSDLNGTPMVVRNIQDADTFTFSCSYGFSTKAETGGGNNMRINSKLHGWRGTQDNQIGGSLYKPIKLSGDNYCFMVCPEIKSDSVSFSGPVKNILAKIFISALPGMVIFNSMDASTLEFDPPIPRLENLRFQIKTAEDYLVPFNGMDYSFGLEIVELHDVNEDTEKSSVQVIPGTTRKQ